MLSFYQKSIYLTIFNATMIGRSLGRSIPENNREHKINNFKKMVFDELDLLCDRMDHGILTTTQIHSSIKRIDRKPNVSFGQAQKAINVIIKCHYVLYHYDEPVRFQLDCPLDSLILKNLGIINKSLSKIKYRDYRKIQEKISQQEDARIDFDKRWDEAHLRRHGLL